MNAKNIAAILLIVVGVIAFAYQGITYTTKEKAIDLGPIQVTTERTHNIPVPPVVSGIMVVGGILLLFIGRK